MSFMHLFLVNEQEPTLMGSKESCLSEVSVSQRKNPACGLEEQPERPGGMKDTTLAGDATSVPSKGKNTYYLLSGL